MMRLSTWIVINHGIFKCPSCEKDLYKFMPHIDELYSPKKKVEAADFEPIGEIEYPVNGQPLKCPLCSWSIGVGHAPVWLNEP